MPDITAFQPDAFQDDAFQIFDDDVSGRPIKVTAAGAAIGKATMNASPILDIQASGAPGLWKVR
jgi:hypothetical protein